MPELPEVETTANGLRKHVIGLKINDIWTNYGSKYWSGSDTVKDPAYFPYFRKSITGQRIISVERRAKNILMNLENGLTVLIHLKMTGHLLYGKYLFNQKNVKDPWEAVSPESLRDPYNRHVRLVFSLSNGKNLALSDVRRFAKVALAPTASIHDSNHLLGIGPEPLQTEFTFGKFADRLKTRSGGKIKQVLTDQTVIAGIGNIYADESLWRAGIHPAEKVENVPTRKLSALYEAVISTLRNGIALGGDSMSDYRNILGEKGAFQEQHCAYRLTGKRCKKIGCKGFIKRMVLGGRGTHFCSVHQCLSKRVQSAIK